MPEEVKTEEVKKEMTAFQKKQSEGKGYGAEPTVFQAEIPEGATLLVPKKESSNTSLEK